MNNKNFEKKVGKLTSTKIIPKKREKVTMNIDKYMWEDIKELCQSLDKQYNVAIESMMALLMENDEFLEKFLEEIERR